MNKQKFTNQDNPSLDDVCYLASEYGKKLIDENGDTILSAMKRMVYCGRLPLFNSEKVRAKNEGISAEEILVVHQDEYEGENKLSYHEKDYFVYKVMPAKNDNYHLFCAEKIGEPYESQ